MAHPPARVLITGAAGQIAYSLIFQIARGNMLGPEQPVILHLFDIPLMIEALGGVVMELEDGAFPLLAGVVPTVDPKEAFTDIDFALFLGATPRREGMERSDLLKENAGIFKTQGEALDKYAKKTVKVLVVGNPANTNCLIAATSAPSIPKENFSALTRLDHNRAKSQIAIKAKVNVNDVHNVIIWGNHSSTQYPDVNHGTIGGHPIRSVIKDDAWLNDEFIKKVQQRGAAVIKARKLSSAASAAKAIVDHIHDWVFGTKDGEFVSMGIWTTEAVYGIQAGLVFSFPVSIKGGKFHIREGLHIDEFSRQKLKETEDELIAERDTALPFLK
eukprot:TRINITY_DN2274_c0_g1_i1.p1 TRINITY_DN2274_c0_g1~~TRINITY_DN2274_c0_g1_i1.p1  ORF type:complete len:330 (+),score=98.78 TRINITY_DN2274_c0_g1_i1:199-1188(+)